MKEEGNHTVMKEDDKYEKEEETNKRGIVELQKVALGSDIYIIRWASHLSQKDSNWVMSSHNRLGPSALLSHSSVPFLANLTHSNQIKSLQNAS